MSTSEPLEPVLVLASGSPRRAQWLRMLGVPFTVQVNPKLDAKQRRLQCSLRFGDFFHFLAPNAESLKQEEPKIFGAALPAEFASPPRRRKK